MALNRETGLKPGSIAAVKPEILAPAGRWEVLEAVVAAGADAVYLGGKKLNMRMWRSEFNFSEAEISRAVEFTHQKGVKLYVTLNNVYFEDDLAELQAYLEFLEQIQVDALIVQDLSVVSLARRLGLTRPLHASVQANIHNLEGLLAYKEMGFERAILSKDLSFEEIYRLGQESGMELEYFVHGDLCVSHTGQCLTSSLIFGESSNRGRCMKPCRWRYQALDPKTGLPAASVGPYVLATKDLCLYPFIPQLIQAGICSFKIEGRMREGAFLAPLVKAYRDAVDRYWDDPQSYRIDEAVWAAMQERRVRDFTAGQALGQVGSNYFGFSGEREPAFPTRPVIPPSLSRVIEGIPAEPFDQAQSARSTASLAELTAENRNRYPQLAVRVGSSSALSQALAAGANTIYVAGEVTAANQEPWGRREVEQALAETRAAGARLVVLTPRITKRREMSELNRWFKELEQIGVDGIMVSNWGTWWLARQTTHLPLYGNFSLNITNSLAANLAAGMGITQAAVSLELSAELLSALQQNTQLPTEVMVHGVLTGMLLELCLPSVLQQGAGSRDVCRDTCHRPGLVLADECGQLYPVEVDQYCRTQVLLPYELCLLSSLPWLVNLQPASLRIEAQNYEPAAVASVVTLYRKYLELAVRQPHNFAVAESDWEILREIHPAGYTLGALGA